MSRYQVYPEYQEVNSDWIGKVPKGWTTSPVKMVSDIFNGATPKSGESSYWDGEISWITPADLGKTDTPLISNGQRSITKIGYESCGTTLVPANSVILSSRAPIGTLGIAEKTLCTNQGCKSLVIKDKFDHKYVYYILLISNSQLNLLGRGTTFLELSSDELGSYQIPKPSAHEQKQIVNFLDHETARIDTLIEKQQQLIKLLKEKRQAVISHAVTKGLNPNVPMKESGVEWLGQVPEHWKIGAIKQFAKIESGHTPDKKKEEYWTDCNIPWVSLNDSKTLKIVDYIEDTKYKVNELGIQNSSARLLPANAVIFTRDASIGLSAITTRPMAVSQHIIAWLCYEDQIKPEFLLLIFYAMQEEFERYTFGATIKTIGMDDVRSLRAAIPPLKEQKAIIDNAFNTMALMDAAINKAESLVSLLQERRTALISAAVTGKIDVRNWKPEQYQPSMEATV